MILQLAVFLTCKYKKNLFIISCDLSNKKILCVWEHLTY